MWGLCFCFCVTLLKRVGLVTWARAYYCELECHMQITGQRCSGDNFSQGPQQQNRSLPPFSDVGEWIGLLGRIYEDHRLVASITNLFSQHIGGSRWRSRRWPGGFSLACGYPSSPCVLLWSSPCVCLCLCIFLERHQWVRAHPDDLVLSSLSHSRPGLQVQ